MERSTVVRWESAETDPQPWHRSRIASALWITLEQLDEMLIDVSVAKRRGKTMGKDIHSPAPVTTRAELLTGLRAFLASYIPGQSAEPARSLAEVRRGVGRVHNLYQRASYRSTARLLPEVLGQATDLAGQASTAERTSAFRLLAAAYLAASKLAAKVGDGDTALLAADRASISAGLAGDRALAGIAAYQAACGLLRLPGKGGAAEQVTQTSIARLASGTQTVTPDLLSARGALLLLAAVIAAGRGSPKEADRNLADAGTLARKLGSDRNCLWTGFGPTNVAIHTVSAAIRAGNASRAVEVGSRLDTSRLPTVLVGRRAQVHVDLAAAAMMGSLNQAAAVLHLIEAERVAAEVVHTSIQARELLRELLSKERRPTMPGLRPLAERAGLLV
ncbi:hypothetical protein DER29_1206 [Micromonospora sp. M71_S20]|nr:hypothetical protein DER29_1206 [Micromonospora sp. M71_S20]